MWDAVVHSRRAADTVSFPLVKPDLRLQTAEQIVKTRFTPETPLEQQVWIVYLILVSLTVCIVELLESRPKLILAKLDRTKILNRARRARFNILVRSNLAILTEVYSPIIAIT